MGKQSPQTTKKDTARSPQVMTNLPPLAPKSPHIHDHDNAQVTYSYRIPDLGFVFVVICGDFSVIRVAWE